MLSYIGSRTIGARSFARQLFKPGSANHQGLHVLSHTKNVVAKLFDIQKSLHISRPTRQLSLEHSAASKHVPIQRTLSPQGQRAFAQTMGLRGSSKYIPRGPVYSRGNVTTQVGLGSARNFCSGQPLFANVARNVPVAGRAFSQINVDLKRQQDGFRKNKKIHKPRAAGVKKSLLKENRALPVVAQDADADVCSVSEVERYFSEAPSEPMSELKTYLLVPLNPPRSSLHSLSPWPLLDSIDTTDTTRLHTPSMTMMHAAHSEHRARITELFGALDRALAWSDPGVTCEPVSIGYDMGSAKVVDSTGIPTHLRITMPGWSAERLLSAIGWECELWCEIEETGAPPASASVATLSPAWSNGHDMELSAYDPSDSLVLPTIMVEPHSAGPDPWRNVTSESLIGMTAHSDVIADTDHADQEHDLDGWFIPDAISVSSSDWSHL